MAEVRPILNGEEAVEKAPEEFESRRLDVTSRMKSAPGTMDNGKSEKDVSQNE